MDPLAAWWEQEAASGTDGRADAYLAIRCEPDAASAFEGDYHILVDRSASMWWADWMAATAEALGELAHRLPPSVHLTVTAFASTSATVVDHASCHSDQVALLGRSIIDAEVGTGSCLEPVLDTLAPATAGRDEQVLLVTDGEPENPEACLGAARRARERGCPLHILAVGREERSPFLAGLAEAGGGDLYHAPTPAAIGQQLDRFVSRRSERVETRELGLELMLRSDIQLLKTLQVCPNWREVEVHEVLPATAARRTFKMALDESPLRPTYAVFVLSVPPLGTGEQGVARLNAIWEGRHSHHCDVRATWNQGVGDGLLASLMRDGRPEDPMLADRWGRAFASRLAAPEPPPAVPLPFGDVGSSRTSRDMAGAITPEMLRQMMGEEAAQDAVAPSEDGDVPLLVIEGRSYTGAASGLGLEIRMDRPVLRLGRCDLRDGRFPDVDLLPFDPGRTVSREHARLERIGNDFFITDLGSTNGTFVPGRDEPLPPHVRHPLKPGDRFFVGKVGMRMVMTAEVPA